MSQYSLPNDARILVFGLTESVIVSTVAAGTLSMDGFRSVVDARIDEAAQAGNYDVPFPLTWASSLSTATNQWVRDTSAIGVVAHALRGLSVSGQYEAAPEVMGYWNDFQARLDGLRKSEVDLGTVVNTETITLPDNEQTWYRLAKRGLKRGTAVAVVGSTTYLEDRSRYEEWYYPDEAHDYQVDHTRGLIRALEEGALQSVAVTFSYSYFLRQPAPEGESEAGGNTIEQGMMVRTDVNPDAREYELEEED